MKKLSETDGYPTVLETQFLAYTHVTGGRSAKPEDPRVDQATKVFSVGSPSNSDWLTRFTLELKGRGKGQIVDFATCGAGVRRRFAPTEELDRHTIG